VWGGGAAIGAVWRGRATALGPEPEARERRSVRVAAAVALRVALVPPELQPDRPASVRSGLLGELGEIAMRNRRAQHHAHRQARAVEPAARPAYRYLRSSVASVMMGVACSPATTSTMASRSRCDTCGRRSPRRRPGGSSPSPPTSAPRGRRTGSRNSPVRAQGHEQRGSGTQSFQLTDTPENEKRRTGGSASVDVTFRCVTNVRAALTGSG
jgi:hypothetical protein